MSTADKWLEENGLESVARCAHLFESGRQCVRPDGHSGDHSVDLRAAATTDRVAYMPSRKVLWLMGGK